MASIKIKGVSPDDPHYHNYKDFAGLVIPLAEIDPSHTPPVWHPGEKPYESGFVVWKHQAVQALRRDNRIDEAYRWNNDDDFLEFRREYCEVICETHD